MKKKAKSKAKYPKLTAKQRDLASKYIGEEIAEKKKGKPKYKRKQAIAIGLSRARKKKKSH